MKLIRKIVFRDFHSRAILIACLLPAWLLAVVLSMPPEAAAQPVSASQMTMKNLKSRFGLNNQQLNQLRPLMERQADGLYKILTKYRNRCEFVFYPFWMDPDIWFDLQILRQEALPNLKKNQQQALHAAFAMMSKEIILTLIDEQVLMLAEELELDSYQTESVYDVLVRNSKKSQLLINSPPLGLEVLSRKLEAIANELEIEFEKALSPEQFKRYQKSKEKFRLDGTSLHVAQALRAASAGGGRRSSPRTAEDF